MIDLSITSDYWLFLAAIALGAMTHFLLSVHAPAAKRKIDAVLIDWWMIPLNDWIDRMLGRG